MSDKPTPTLLRYLRGLTRPPAGGWSDGRLLERFVVDGDEAAFELLVWRHAPMVLGVCRRVLPAVQDAEDAFQATFLVFVRKAHAIRQREGVAAWLYRVAHHVALRARARTAKRAGREKPGVDLDAVAGAGGAEWSDLRPLLDEEISRLPERYRVPVVLCYLEGRSNREAAEQLGCAEGTVASRLSRARDRLRARLTRRGLALSAAALTAVVAREARAAAAPELVRTTVGSAGWFAVGGTTPAGAAAPAALAEGVLKTMWVTKFRIAATLLLLAAGVGVGGSGLVYRGVAGDPAKPGAIAPAPADDGGRHLVNVPSRVDGILEVIGTEIKEGEKVPPKDTVTLKVGNEEKKYRRLYAGDKVDEGQLLARLEDDEARDQLAIKQAQVESAKADQQASLKTRDEAERRWQVMERLVKQKGASQEDLRGAKLTYDRYFQEEISKREAVKQAEAEVRVAQNRLRMHEIRSPARGIITKMYRYRGEAVRTFEPVLQILTAPERND
jgi:RNA polymerase sigma factor (sigma-70 family)